MNPNVIENDPKKVKQYMQNFVPVNFYQVLGDSYLSQVRAVLNYSNLEYELSNPVYDQLISDLTSKTISQGKAIAELESKYDKVLSGVNTRIDGISEFESAIGDKVRLYENTIKLQTDSLQSIENNIRASIKNVDVGGRNLIANSDLRFGNAEREDTKVTLADHALGKLISAKSNAETGNVFGVESGGQYTTINLIEGKEYTISFYAYGSLKTLDEIKLISLSGETVKIPSITINSDLTERYSYTFTAPSTADDYGYQLLATSTGVNSWFSYTGLKLEIGNVATDWSPNPKDLDDIQDDIYSNIKEFKQTYVDENSATTEKLEQLTARHLENKAEITEHKKTYASQYAAQAQTINELVVNVGTNTSKISDIDTVYANKYTAVAERATALEAKTATAQADIKDLNKATATNTQAIVDSSREMKAELGSVEVGGRNLIRNSDLANGEQLLGGATVVKGDSSLGKTNTFTATSPDIAFGFKQITEDAKIPVVKNQRYTLSVYASASKNITEINYIYLRSEDGFVQKLPNLAVDDMFAMRGSVTFTADFTSSVAAITFACTDAIAGSWFKIAGLKLEKGTKATDYSPAPEDIIGFIDKVEATYNEYVKLNATKDKATAERFSGLEARTKDAEGSITRIDGIVATHAGTIATHDTRITTAYNNAGLALDKANDVDVIAKRADAAAIQANTNIQLLETSISNEQLAQIIREEEIRTSISQQAGEIAALKGGGRNLLLQTQPGAVEGKYLTKAGVETASTLWKITPYIAVRGEIDYFTSAKGTMDYGTVQSMVFYDSSKKFIIGYAGIDRKLVTSPANASYVRISFLKTDYPSIMFQEGNVPSKWAPAPEDLNKEIQDLQDLIGGLDFSVDQAILDGVVDQAEAKQLNVLLLQLNTEKAELAARITTFEGNTDLTPATLDQLRQYWTAYGLQHTAVVDICNNIIESGAVSDATKLQLKTEFSLYSSALANLVTGFEVATDSVGSTRMITVASDAEKKIQAAEAAAKVFATAEAELKRIEAEAYADGVITKEEAARIAEAKQNLADAKADSTTKANSAAKAAKDYADAQDVKKLTEAKSYADNKASLAKQGAEAYALAQIELNTIETNAYADGIVTAEEQARIAEATANLNAAKTEAKRLADAAEVAAKNFATQKADAALALAKTDAKTKADAAQTAAQGYALAQADAKRIEAEAYADGIVTVEELARIKHANEVLVAAKADSLQKANDARDSAQAYADLGLKNLVIGGRNLLITTDASIVKGKYISSKGVATSSALWLISGSIPITAGYDYIISGITNLGTAPATVFYNASGTVISGLVGTKRISFVAPAGAVSMKVSMLQTDLPKVMIENGTKASSLSVAPEDVAKYAQDAATAAQNAAKAYTEAQNNLKLVEAKAYADGIVTTEEAARIEQAAANLELAKLDATGKAEEARDAAQAFATAKDTLVLQNAQTDAKKKADAAKEAAQLFATAEAEAKRVLAEAYADNIVTAEEQRAIKDANDKLAAAKADANTKANAARDAAKTFATVEANRVLGLAKTDAQTKADAAKLAAQTFATAEANAKQVLAQAYADGIVTAEEARAIKDANDKLAVAKADATKKADEAAAAAKVYSDLQLENLVIGGTNMIDNSNFATKSLAKWSNNGSVSYISIDNRDCAYLNVTNGIYQTATSKSNVVHSISFWAKAADPAVATTLRVGFLNQTNCHKTFTLTSVWKQYTFTTTAKVSVGQTFHIYSGGKRSYVTDVKVEEGSKVSTWTPSNNDIKAYADSTSLASENAAKAFATAEANAKRVLAEAYADGKVTAEESKRIADVNAKLVLAKADAQAKADAAAKAAKDYADTQISNIEIGGRNLLKGTSTEATGTNYEFYGYKDLAPIFEEHGLIEYTISVDLKTPVPGRINIYSQNGSGTKYGIGEKGCNVTTEWQRFTHTFTPSLSSTTETRAMVAFYGTYKTGRFIQLRNFKIEKGNKATDWSPAPEDITKSVTDLGESLKDFKGVNITTFSDGLISKSEAKAMDVSKSHLERGFKEINSRYTAIYGNTGLTGTPKTQLKSAYDLWAGTHTSTLGYISTLVTKGTVSLAESAEVTKRFNAYNTNLDALATKLESAQDSIVKALSAKASSDAVNAISIGGRNLMVMANHAFDKGKYLTKTGTFTASTSWWTTDFIPVTGGKEYITTAVPNPNYNTTVGTCYYDASKVLISCVVGATARRLSTAPATAKFLRMSYVPADFPRLMLEEGNIPSNYAPSPEDVHASALDVGKAFTAFEDDFNKTIKDDIITKAEASSLFSLLKVLESESNALAARKDSLVANSSISASSKTALNTAYTSYAAQYKALTDHMSASNLAQDLTSARKTAMVTLFNSYKSALSGLTKAIETALDSISASRVEAIKLGGRNLLKLSGSKITNNKYDIADYTLTEKLSAGEDVVITLWGTLGSDRNSFRAYNSGGSVALKTLSLVSPGVYRGTTKWKLGGDNTFLRIYQSNSANTSSSTIEKIQLEKGNIGTDWTIAPEDITDLTIESDNKIKLVTEANSSLTESYNKTTETTTASFKAIQTGENNMLENSGLVEINRAPFSNSVATLNSTYPGHWVIGGNNYIQVDFPSLVTGTTYTFSYEIARNLAATVVTTSIGTYSSKDTTVNQLASTKHVLTFAAKADTTFARISSASAGQVALITNVKLEKGSKATSGLSGTLIDTIAELKETKKTATDLKGNVESTWSMEASVNGEISGIYLTKGNKKSDFKVLAEKFQVVNAGGSAVVPFRVEGNKAYAKDLIVGTANITGSLTIGHIPNNLITLDKMVPAERDKINKAANDIANLEIGGRNLIVSSSLITGKYLVESTGNLGAAGTHTATDFIPVNPSSSYIFSELTTGIFQVRFVYYTSDKARITGKLYAGAQGKSLIATTPANAAYIRISGEHTASRSNLTTWKFEKGNVATDWTPAPEDIDADATTKANAAKTFATTEANRVLGLAKTDAQTKANAAKTAAETYALAQAEAKRVLAQTYADGKVSTEEKARIADVNAKLATAKTDATTKANAAQTAAQTYAKAQADAALASAKTDATTKANAAKTHAENIAKVEVIDAKTKRFISPASYSSAASAVTGYLIIETPITASRMVKLNITGYNYQANKTNIDLSVGFYFNGSFVNFDYADMGTYPIENVRLGIKSSKVVVIIGNATSTWSYPKINITQAIIGYTATPDTYKTGWVIRHATTITDITGVKAMDNIKSVSIKSLQDNVYVPGTVEINGGNIKAGTVTATQINAAQLKVTAANVTGKLTAAQIDATSLKVTSANVTGKLTAAQISTTNLSSLSSNLGSVTAGSINIGGKFIVDSSGNVTAKSGTFDGTVKIANAQVDTLQIANNAVTISRATSTDSVTEHTSGSLSLTLNTQGGGAIITVVIEKVYAQTQTKYRASMTFNLYRGTTLIKTWLYDHLEEVQVPQRGGDSVGTVTRSRLLYLSTSLSYIDNPPTGDQTYKLTWSSTRDATARGVTFSILGTKR